MPDLRMRPAEAVTAEDVDAARRKLQHYLLRWRRSPVAYAWEACRCSLTFEQAHILNTLVRDRFVAVVSGRGIGKSRLLGIAVNWFLDTQWETGTTVKVPCTGPSAGSLISVLWGEVNTVHKLKAPWLQKQFEHNSDRQFLLEDRDSVFAEIRTSRKENPDALQGFHGKILYILDEASGVDDPVFEVFLSGMTDQCQYALMTGNPTRTSGYFDKVTNGEGEIKSRWTVVRVSSLDSLATTVKKYRMTLPNGDIVTREVAGRVNPEWVEAMRNEYGEDSNVWRVHVTGERASLLGDVVIPTKGVQAALARESIDQGKRRRVMGVDVARSGRDDSAMVVRHGRTVELVDSWHGYDTYLTKHKVETVYHRYARAGTPIDDICIDAIGYGAGIADDLSHRRYPVTAVVVSERAREDKEVICDRMRDWLWWQGRKFFDFPSACILKEAGTPELLLLLSRELTTPTYAIPLAAIKVESKDDLAKRGFHSPNIADAFLLTLVVDPEDRATPRQILGKRELAAARERRNWRVI